MGPKADGRGTAASPLSPERWETAAVVADYLSKPVSWVRNNISQLPHRKVGNHLRFRLSEIDAWLDGLRDTES
jgi:hypothetical protein